VAAGLVVGSLTGSGGLTAGLPPAMITDPVDYRTRGVR
jgi:hypothetical protein